MILMNSEGIILIYIEWNGNRRGDNCCGQLWVRHMICGQTCDGLFGETISTLAVKLSVSAIFTPRWTATIIRMCLFRVQETVGISMHGHERAVRA